MSSRIGELLVSKKLLTEEQLTRAKEVERQEGIQFTTALTKSGFIEENKLVETLAQQYRLPVSDLEAFEADQTVIGMVPYNLAQKYQILPMEKAGNTITVAMVDPSNIIALNDIKFITGCDVKVTLAHETQLKSVLEKNYESDVSYEGIIDNLVEDDVEVMTVEEEMSVDDLEKATEDAPVVKLVNAILTDAVKKGASDVHVEPYEKSFRVRFRIDGVLYEIMKPPFTLKNAITSRIKIMADLDIAERRLPQDGRIKLKLGGRREMDFRVSVLPGLFGEKVVLRLLDKSNLQTDMSRLGFLPEQLVSFQEAIAKPFGMVLVTGPTGSGKTTTLYSALTELNKNTVNISTAEDPVEFNLRGINQVQMNEDIGLNFAAALRSFLRQDPDVVMVGEIRDYETAEIAIKASLTGHLVLSTLHTNDAPSTVNRLLNMGVEPFLVASSINIIVAQRLARRICDNCKEKQQVHPDVLIRLGMAEEEAKKAVIQNGKGCDKCSGTGYKGRVALYEAMTMSESLREYVLNGASAAELKRAAIAAGMRSLRGSGIYFLKEGVTTIEEVLRVTALD